MEPDPQNLDRLAVIDLGTNTFHMLIVEVLPDASFRQIYRDPVYVYLAEDGIDTIGDKPFQRGLETLIRFQEKIEAYQVDAIRVFGTEALRRASNGQQFRKEVKELTGIEIELISGDEEARLIAKGTRLAVPAFQETILVMDVGGGSVEFILMDAQKLIWKQSFRIGISVLYKTFHQIEPIPNDQIQALFDYLDEVLVPLKKQLDEHPVKIIAGASAGFEIVQEALNIPQQNPDFAEINAVRFLETARPFYRLALEERKNHPQIPADRAELFIVSLLLNDWTLENTQAETIWISAYAMKEGMLAEMISERKF